MRIAVYAPVLNESRHVQRWADTTKDADVRVWLDTGSVDATPRLAADAGITVVSGSFQPFRFDDARNAALALVPQDVDLCLMLDADEVLSDGWRDDVEAHAGHARYTYLMVSTSPGWRSQVRRNLHARSGFRWHHPVHEVLVGAEPTCHLAQMTVTHMPDMSKKRRYLAMLEQAVREDPDSARMSFYYARELFYRNRWDLARREFVRYLSLGDWTEERSEAFRFIAAMDDDPQRWLLRSIAESPKRREPWVDLCRLYLRQGMRQRALGAYLGARECWDETLYITQPNAWGDAFDALGSEVGA